MGGRSVAFPLNNPWGKLVALAPHLFPWIFGRDGALSTPKSAQRTSGQGWDGSAGWAGRAEDGRGPGVAGGRLAFRASGSPTPTRRTGRRRNAASSPLATPRPPTPPGVPRLDVHCQENRVSTANIAQHVLPQSTPSRGLPVGRKGGGGLLREASAQGYPL